ncbi:hypothetical protein PA598K_01838 [Paenibacillus sp. 598K]|nr:hypothetical protein PA598K_01838 [Paenibacillus sp. 598K]
MSTVVPTNDKAAVVLKNADMEVIVPFLGITEAKFSMVSPEPVKSMIPPYCGTPLTELPKPSSADVLDNPPAIVVTTIG